MQLIILLGGSRIDKINFLYYNPGGEHSKTNDAVYSEGPINIINPNIRNFLSFSEVAVKYAATKGQRK